jgi:hypothetical protein
MGATPSTVEFVHWRDELNQIANWLDQNFPGKSCPEPLDVQVRRVAARLRAMASERRRSRDGYHLQATVQWIALDITDRYDCTTEQAEEFLGQIEDDLQLAMIATGWRVIESEAPFDGYEDDSP